jgi:hypothetical protein
LLVERVEFAHRWNVKEDVAEQFDVTLKRTLSRDHFAQEASHLGVMNLYGFQPLLHLT